MHRHSRLPHIPQPDEHSLPSMRVRCAAVPRQPSKCSYPTRGHFFRRQSGRLRRASCSSDRLACVTHSLTPPRRESNTASNTWRLASSVPCETRPRRDSGCCVIAGPPLLASGWLHVSAKNSRGDGSPKRSVRCAAAPSQHYGCG